MELQDYRERLDQIDGQLAELFKQRMETVKLVADYKKEHNTPVYAANRERDILYGSQAYAARNWRSTQKFCTARCWS